MGKLRNYKSESAAVSRVDFGLVAATCCFFLFCVPFAFVFICVVSTLHYPQLPLCPLCTPRLLVWLRLPFWLVFIFVGVGRQIDFMSETS